MATFKYRGFLKRFLLLSRPSLRFVKVGIWIIVLFASPGLIMAQQTSTSTARKIRKVDKYIIPPSKQKIRRNPNIRTRFPTRGRPIYNATVREYRNRLMAEKKRRLARVNGQRYQIYQDRYNDVQIRLKKAKEAALAAKEEVPVEEPPQPTAAEQRLLQNKEILEGKRDPVVKDDPNYLKFIEEKTQLTKR